MRILQLLLVLIVAGLSVGRTLGADKPRNFAQWEKDIAGFEAKDKLKSPPKDGILFVGSSIIARWNTLAEAFPEYPVFNRGFGGSQIRDTTHFAPRMIFPYRPRSIYLRAGGNDLWGGRSVELVFGDFKEFVATVQAQLPDTDIVYISNFRSIARLRQAQEQKALDDAVARFVQDKPHLRVIDIFELMSDAAGNPRPELFVKDGLHLSPAGYELLAKRVRVDLEAAEKARATPTGAH